MVKQVILEAVDMAVASLSDAERKKIDRHQLTAFIRTRFEAGEQDARLLVITARQYARAQLSS